MIEPSTLTLLARGLRSQINKYTEIAETNVLVGHPAYVGPDVEGHKISIYFYRIYESGNTGAIYPDSRPIDVVVNCLFTAMGVDSVNDSGAGAGEGITSGENDLSLLGKIIQGFYENPILKIIDKENYEICRVEITPIELSVDELSKIVPTAPEKGGFRPSVAYALSLVPLPYNKEIESESRVQIVTWGISPTGDPTRSSPQDTFSAITSEVEGVIAAGISSPHLLLNLSNDENTYYRRVLINNESELVNFRIFVPASILAIDDSIKLSQKYWVVDDLNYKSEKEKTAVYINQSDTSWELPESNWIVDKVDENFQFDISWEFNDSLVGQHLFQTELIHQGNATEPLKGNICMVVVAPGSVASDNI